MPELEKDNEEEDISELEKDSVDEEESSLEPRAKAEPSAAKDDKIPFIGPVEPP